MARIGQGEPVATTQTLRRRFFSLAGLLPAKHAVSACISPWAGPGKTSSAPPWPDYGPCRSLPDAALGV